MWCEDESDEKLSLRLDQPQGAPGGSGLLALLELESQSPVYVSLNSRLLTSQCSWLVLISSFEFRGSGVWR